MIITSLLTSRLHDNNFENRDPTTRENNTNAAAAKGLNDRQVLESMPLVSGGTHRVYGTFEEGCNPCVKKREQNAALKRVLENLTLKLEELEETDKELTLKLGNLSEWENGNPQYLTMQERDEKHRIEQTLKDHEEQKIKISANIAKMDPQQKL